MARQRTEIDLDAALDLLARGEKIPAISTELGVSQDILRHRIAELERKQGLLLQYRALQSLQLTELQARLLESITPQKIEEAPLKDLVSAYKILKDKEQVIEGKPSEIKGLVSHLIHLEKLEQAQKCGTVIPDVQDAVFTDDVPEEKEDEPEAPSTLLCSLSDLDQQRF